MLLKVSFVLIAFVRNHFLSGCSSAIISSSCRKRKPSAADLSQIESDDSLFEDLHKGEWWLLSIDRIVSEERIPRRVDRKLRIYYSVMECI